MNKRNVKKLINKAKDTSAPVEEKAQALLSLGDAFYTGKGEKQKYEEVFREYLKSASYSMKSRSYLFMAWLALNGYLVEEGEIDHETSAFNYYRRACDWYRPTVSFLALKTMNERDILGFLESEESQAEDIWEE